MEYDIELTKILCDEGAEAILYGDDSAYKTGPFIHPKLYEKYIYPRLKRILQKQRSHLY
jgi:uroporphyrinogen decarboxylase